MSASEGKADQDTVGPMRRRIIIYAVALIVAFLVGLLPMWLVARGRAHERDTAQRDLKLCRLENNLLSATVDSRRGEYERARASASTFFTSLREAVDLARENSALTATQQDNLRPLLNQRDDLITLLARSDPASADRLAELYVSFRKGLGDLQP